jgi:hypothetical protein
MGAAEIATRRPAFAQLKILVRSIVLVKAKASTEAREFGVKCSLRVVRASNDA